MILANILAIPIEILSAIGRLTVPAPDMHIV